MKFKVGDTVKVKECAVHKNCKNVGKEFVISDIANYRAFPYALQGCGELFNDNELEPINGVFKKSDLLAGYLVERMDGAIRMVMPTQSGLCLTDGALHLPLDYYNNNLESIGALDKDCSIKRVYGYADNQSQTLRLKTNGRELIWERPEVKELTIADIEEKFGCKLKIIKEEN